MQRLTVGQLRQHFAEVFGEATAASNRTWLVKRIAWRLQALAEGDLSERARRGAVEQAVHVFGLAAVAYSRRFRETTEFAQDAPR